MKKFIQLISILALISSFLVIISTSIADQPKTQKTPVTKEPTKPPVPPPAPPPSPKPDLAINKVWIGKYVNNQYVPVTGALTAGEKYYLICEYSNIGNDLPNYPYRPSFRIGFYVENVLIYSTEMLGAIPSGKILTQAAEYIPDKGGSRKGECVLDYENKIAEQTKDNNRMEMTFNVVVTDMPTYGKGVNLQITAFRIDNPTSLINVKAKNFGGPMTRDAKVKLYIYDKVQKEYTWTKDKMEFSFSVYVFQPPNSIIVPNIYGKCVMSHVWGVHVEIVPGSGERVSDTSGQSKDGTLNALQDLAVDHFTKDPGGRIQAVIMNKGICDSETWSYRVRFYKEGGQDSQEMTMPLIGPIGSLKAGDVAFANVPTPYAGTTAIELEVVPKSPNLELRSDNNKYRSVISDIQSGFDLTVTDIKFKGEIMNWGDKYRDEDVYYEICPIVKNIGNADMPYSFLEVETFIDGVSSGKGNCNTSLPKQKELTFWNLCQTGAILPRGIHTVKFQINTQDVFNGNNSLNKTMFRP